MRVCSLALRPLADFPPLACDFRRCLFVFVSLSLLLLLQTSGFHIVCGVLIGVFIAMEMGLNELIIYLTNKVMRQGVVGGQ